MPKWLYRDRWSHQRTKGEQFWKEISFPQEYFTRSVWGLPKHNLLPGSWITIHWTPPSGSGFCIKFLPSNKYNAEERRAKRHFCHWIGFWMLMTGCWDSFQVFIVQERKAFLTAFSASLGVCLRLLIIWDPIIKFSRKILVSFRLQWLKWFKFLKDRLYKSDFSQGFYCLS